MHFSFIRPDINMNLLKYYASKAGITERLKTLKQLLQQNAKEFCRNTSLHGLKYLTNDDLYPLERLFFGLAFITVVILSGVFIQQVHYKWNTTPVIFSINPEPTHITKEPFPAITICNLNQAQKSIADGFAALSTEHAMLQLLCKREVNASILDAVTDWNRLNEFIINVSQPCSHMLLRCRYGPREYNCSRIFFPIVTEEGLCCFFNMVHPSFMFQSIQPPEVNASLRESDALPVDWSVESGYPKNLPKRYYPATILGTGASLGLSLTLNAEANNYYCSTSNSVGFKIALHNPTELPNIREVGLPLSAGRETKILLQIKKIESDQYLRKIDKRYRKCLFKDELKLWFFSHYSQRNCEFECLGGILLRRCGCLAHHLPRAFGNETVCNIDKSRCVEDTRLNTMRIEGSKFECLNTCLPSCHELSYFAEYFTTELTHSGFQVANHVVQKFSNRYVKKNLAVVNIFFKDSSFRSIKQTEFIGVTDFLSSVGGLISVFFGFSFLSIVELIFYALIRPFRRVRKTAIPTGNVNTTKFGPPMAKRVRRRYHDSHQFYAEYTQRLRLYRNKNNINWNPVFAKTVSETVQKF